MSPAFAGNFIVASITTGKLVFTGLPLESLDVLSAAIDLGLIAVDLLLLLIVGDLMTLQLIAN